MWNEKKDSSEQPVNAAAVLHFIDRGKSSAFFVHLAKGRFKLAHSAAVIIEFRQGEHQSALRSSATITPFVRFVRDPISRPNLFAA